MIILHTYQDLLAVGANEIERGRFCRTAINSFKGTQEYKDAVVGEAYYNRHNLTIEKYQKFIYTLTGEKMPDLFSANYKLKTTFFRRLVIQQVQYVLGNGLTLSDSENKKKLGKDFDFKLQLAAKRAMASGRAFGFWNQDHLEVFSYADTPSQPGFYPLYCEETSNLKAGIRYWFRRAGDKIVFRCTLFEVDGYTEYIQPGDEDIRVAKPKQRYKSTIKSTDAGGIEETIEENYNDIPIVQLFANDTHESELVGIRECIDCYDLIKSGLANDIDDLSGFYWILQNNGGMDDLDLVQFIQKMKTVRAAVVEDVEDVKTDTPAIPTEARMSMLTLLRKDIYEDFQALDITALTASAKTQQELKSSYQAQDNKCADFEYYLLGFCRKILELAGIADEPSFNWNRIINHPEQTNMILTAANYLSDECIIKLLPFLTPEQADAEIEKLHAKEIERFNAPEEDEIELSKYGQEKKGINSINPPEEVGDEETEGGDI